MQNENRGLFSAIENYIDMLINLISFVMGYLFVIMIEGDIINLAHPITIVLLFLNMIASSIIYHAMNLYTTSRYMKPYRSLPAVLKANAVYFGINTVIAAFITAAKYKQFILFWILFSAILSTSFLTFKRHMIRLFLQLMRSKQYHLRKVIIIGDNTATAVDYIKEVASGNSQYGMMVIGYVGSKIDPDAIGVEKLGDFGDLDKILEKYRPTDAVFAIDAYDKKHLIRLVNMCDDRCVKVYFLPVIYGFFKNSRQIEQLGSIPLINIHSTPLDNMANAALKRAMDIIGSLALILVTAPIMIFAAIGVYISSPGPILFKQKRVGRLGKRFTMLKFRSMRVNADSNKAWTTGDDPRKTRFGTFLRRTAIDELPQLFNVLMGSMSLVGPRPEIPVFVEHFKEIVPLYMIKHYVKPGLTGLAQIKGFRGDTSIEARIHEDIEYIENWSIWLDFYVLLKTPLKAINKNERYVKSGDNKDKHNDLEPSFEPSDVSDSTVDRALNEQSEESEKLLAEQNKEGDINE